MGHRSLSARRAWIEMSFAPQAGTIVTASLSARRAWIEIPGHHGCSAGYIVALRKESVDRNAYKWFSKGMMVASLSARRAWIEISKCFAARARAKCRSPQGERG